MSDLQWRPAGWPLGAAGRVRVAALRAPEHLQWPGAAAQGVQDGVVAGIAAFQRGGEGVELVVAAQQQEALLAVMDQE